MRTLVKISIALAVAVGTVTAAAHAVDGGTAPERAQRAASNVVTRADAVPPRKGRDYRLLTTLRGRDARRVVGVTTSGEVVLGWYAGFHDTPHHALLDPVSGHRTPLPATGAVLAATERTVTLAASTPGYRRPLLLRLNRATGHVRRFRLPEVAGPQHYTILGLDGPDVWFANGENQDHSSPDRVSSVRFGRQNSLEHHGRHSSPAFAGGVLAWVVRSIDGPDVIASRAVSGGPVTRVTLPEACQARTSHGDLMSNGRQIVVDAYCSNRRGQVGPASELRSQPTFVVDPAVGVVTELRVESDEGALETSDRTVSFYWYSFDLATGTLYDVSDRTGLAGVPPTTGPGDHPIALWPRGHGDGARVLVVRLT